MQTATPHSSCVAAVFSAPGEAMRLESFALPVLAANEALVQVTCCTLCGSDLHTFQGHRSTPLPTVLGHEIIGRIAALPTLQPPRAFDGAPLEIGQRVTWSIMASCGVCFYCTQGLPQKCTDLLKYGHESTRGRFALSGGLGEYCHLAPGTAIIPLGEELPDAVASPASCATATVRGALRTAGTTVGAHVLVMGAGTLGLTACAMAAAAKAASVIACDIDPARLELARRFGASATLRVQDDAELTAQVKTLTEDRGADIALDFTGAPAAMEQALGSLRVGGTCVFVGAVFPTPPIALDPERVVRRMLTIRGLHNYIPQDLADAVLFLQKHHGQFPFAELVTATFSLRESDAAFRHAIAHHSPRVAILARDAEPQRDRMSPSATGTHYA